MSFQGGACAFGVRVAHQRRFSPSAWLPDRTRVNDKFYECAFSEHVVSEFTAHFAVASTPNFIGTEKRHLLLNHHGFRFKKLDCQQTVTFSRTTRLPVDNRDYKIGR